MAYVAVTELPKPMTATGHAEATLPRPRLSSFHKKLSIYPTPPANCPVQLHYYIKHDGQRCM